MMMSTTQQRERKQKSGGRDERGRLWRLCFKCVCLSVCDEFHLNTRSFPKTTFWNLYIYNVKKTARDGLRRECHGSRGVQKKRRSSSYRSRTGDFGINSPTLYRGEKLEVAFVCIRLTNLTNSTEVKSLEVAFVYSCISYELKKTRDSALWARTSFLRYLFLFCFRV